MRDARAGCDRLQSGTGQAGTGELHSGRVDDLGAARRCRLANRAGRSRGARHSDGVSAPSDAPHQVVVIEAAIRRDKPGSVEIEAVIAVEVQVLSGASAGALKAPRHQYRAAGNVGVEAF